MLESIFDYLRMGQRVGVERMAANVSLVVGLLMMPGLSVENLGVREVFIV